jgi:PAS domain S-box-containing protein
MNDPGNVFKDSRQKIDKSYTGQGRIFLILVAAIFLAEVVAMIIIYYLPPMQYWIETLLDASIMIVMIVPVLYYLHLRPLLIQVNERVRSERLLREVVEDMPVGVWIVDKTGMIQHGNQASRELWSGARYVGIDQYGEYKAWRMESGEMVQPDEWAGTRSVRSGETTLNEELEIECFDGTHKMILNSATPIWENGTIQGAIVVNQDITGLKRAEQALAKSEALFKTAFQVLPVGAWITDEQGKIIFGNPAGQEIWAGARYVGVEQFGEYKAWWLDSRKLISADEWAIARAITNGETSLNEEIEIECFDGSHKIILNSAIPVCDEQGQMYGVFVVNQDITERKKFEQALIHSNELIQKAFDSIDILIAYMDRDFNFIQVNEAYASSAGHPVDFFDGKNHFELYPHPENQAIFQQVVDTGEPFSVLEKPFEYPEYPEQGVTYWNWRLQPVKGVDGVVQGLVLSLVDVTERKQAQMLLERQNQDLHELSIAEGKQRQLAEGLVQAMLSLNASLELQEVLDRTLRQIRLSIPYEAANILLIEKDSLRVVHHHDPDGDLEKLAIPEKPYVLEDYPFLKEMCSTQQPVLVEDAPAPHITIPGMVCLNSYLGVPLVVGERVIGMINLTSSHVGIFSQETARRLMAFTAPAALAVENARLFAAELKARQLSETLNLASLALTQILNFEGVMNTLLEYVCRLVPSDRAYVVISRDETNMAIQSMRGYESETNPLHEVDETFDVLDKPYLQQVITSQKSLLIPDTQQYPGWKTLITRENIRSWLGIPFMVGNETLGVLALASTRPDFYTEEHIWLSEVIIAQASVAIQNAWLFDQVRAGHERLQSLSRRLVEIQESERRYIARELHDEASQSLTALMFGLRLLEQEVHKPEQLLSRLAELKKLTDSVLEGLHRLAMGLRPASLDYLGLEEAIEQLVKDVRERYNLSVHFKAIGERGEERMPNHVETTVYRIIQEALTNIVRHAGAKNIDVILESQSDKTIIIIEDDGVGFDITNKPTSGHLGLLGMQERAQMISGALQVESSPGCGTTIVLEVPNADSNSNR